MLDAFLISQITAELPFAPNEEQKKTIGLLAAFLLSQSDKPCFLLRGYAGTGKTSLMAALVRVLKKVESANASADKENYVLLAPTGRAAKVLGHYAGHNAFTIHKCIYRGGTLLPGNDSRTPFALQENKRTHTLFIVDEAGMISRNLLDDLMCYVYQGAGCKLLLLGDDAQLPPVEMSASYALDPTYLAGYGVDLSSACLTEVARQALDSGILSNATRLRDYLTQGFPTPVLTPAEDMQLLAPQAMVEAIEDSYRTVGEEETLIITRSNYRTNLYNQGIRARILYREEDITTGDRIMVCRNNYYQSRDYDDLPFIANGDMFTVIRLRNEREMYGFRFADATLQSVDYGHEIDALLWLDTLTTATPDDHYTMQRTLFERIAEDYPELTRQRDKIERIKESPYFNALQIRFAYAVTCHKAQGGQWRHVFIDPERIPTDGTATNEDTRWLYTALTRATEKAMVNFKK